MTLVEMTSRRLLGIRLAAAAAIAFGIWALVLWIGGGFDAMVFGLRVRSTDPARPRLLAELAFLGFAWLRGFARTKADLDVIGNRILHEWPRVRAPLAAALAAGVCAFGVLKVAPVAGGSDSYGYVSQIDLWLHAHPFVEQPWVDKVPWPDAAQTFTPLGYRFVPSGTVIVPSYSPGLPLIMALVKIVAGYRAMFVVGPLSAAILVLATYGLGRRLGSPDMGVIAAWLVACSPSVLDNMLVVMSDIPAAAGWALAFYLLFGRSPRSAAGAGLAAGIATLIRPNLVPAAGVMGAWLIFKLWRDPTRRSLHFRRTVGFIAGLVPALAALAGLFWWLYGSPVRSGYGPLGEYYDASHILPNLHSYLSWLAESQTPFAYLGFAGLALAVRRLWPLTPDRSMVVALGAFVMTLWGQYAAFQLLSSWIYLRYVVASWPALMLGVAAVALVPIRWAGKPAMLVTTVVIIGVGWWTVGFAGRTGGLTARQGEHKFPGAGTLARGRTGEASVVLAGLHSGSMRYYGGRMTMRADVLDREWLDRSVEWFDQRGIHTYALLEQEEVESFLDRFAGQQRARLTGRLVFVYRGTSTVYFYDLSRPEDQPLRPETVTETYAGPAFIPPAPVPTLALER
jgi:hypothetical protein